MTKVVNLKKEPYDVYIGRFGHGQSGYFGNPIELGKFCQVCKKIHYTAGSTLDCYKEYFYNRLNTDKTFQAKVLALKGKTLGCFCKPKPCHGDIIIEWIENETTNND